MALAPYAEHNAATERLFMAALRKELGRHAAANKAYGAFLSRRGFSPEADFCLEDVPFLPARLFKTMGSQLATVPQAEIHLLLTSSATSGAPSTVPINRTTSRRQARCMAKILANFIGKGRRPFLFLDVDPSLAARTGSYGARGAALRGYMGFARSSGFFLEEGSGGLVFNERRFTEAVSALDPAVPVVLFGFTYVAYAHVIRPALLAGKHYELPAGSFFLHIGGWKKLEAEKVPREKLLADANAVFGLAKSNILDIYGFTEQMGLNYPDCPCGYKHVPHLSRLIIRDPLTHAPLPVGETGLLEFVSPLEQSYAGAAVLTDDIGRLIAGACPAGRGGQRFEVLGRLKKAEARGCGDILGEKMRNLHPGASLSPSAAPALRLATWGGPVSGLDELGRRIRQGRAWLEQQPAEGIIGLIAKTAASWLDNPALAALHYNGLAYLSRWCSAPNLRALASQALRGMPGSLDGFVPEAQRPKHYLRAFPRGIVVHWVAGNVPFLAMLVLAQSLVAKNGNILKTAANNFTLLRELLETFAGKEYVASDGAVTRGDDLLATIALVHYPHEDVESAAKLSALADCRVAWGGRQAVDAICSLPCKAEAVDLVFGPKTSFMVIAREMLTDEKAVAALLRRAATDVSSFDQTACSSPHTIFVEAGGCVTALQFAEKLGGYLARAIELIPKNPEDEAVRAAVQDARAVGEFMGRCWRGDGWTVLYDEQPGLARPVCSRTITVRPVNSIFETVQFVSGDIQSIGLAARGARRYEYATAAGSKGALRFPEIGAMTGFDAPWDGMFVMDHLVRWVSLGGMASAIASHEAQK